MLVAVIGGGVAGLAAAHEVTRLRPDVDVVVLEQAPAVGGKLRSATLAGHTVDVGAESMLARRPEGLELIDSAGLTESRVSPLTTSARVWSPAGPRPIPTGTVMGVPGDLDAARRSGLFSDATLARLTAEQDADFAPITEDVAVGRLVGQRFGPEVVDRLVDPLLGGVYAGRADRLSLRATVPALAQALAERRVAASGRAPAVTAATPRRRPGRPPQPVFASVLRRSGPDPGGAGGTGLVHRADVDRGAGDPAGRRSGFVLAIGARPGRTRAAGRRGHRGHAGGQGRRCCSTSSRRPPRPSWPGSRRRAWPSCPIAVPTGDALDLPPGSGLLVPAGCAQPGQGRHHQLPEVARCARRVAFVRASIGRFGDEAVLQRDDAELMRRAVGRPQPAAGTGDRPVDAVVTRWGGALPQYEVGHVERVARIRAGGRRGAGAGRGRRQLRRRRHPGLRADRSVGRGAGPAAPGDSIRRRRRTIASWSTENRHANSTTSSATPPGRCSRCRRRSATSTGTSSRPRSTRCSPTWPRAT